MPRGPLLFPSKNRDLLPNKFLRLPPGNQPVMLKPMPDYLKPHSTVLESSERVSDGNGKLSFKPLRIFLRKRE